MSEYNKPYETEGYEDEVAEYESDASDLSDEMEDVDPKPVNNPFNATAVDDPEYTSIYRPDDEVESEAFPRLPRAMVAGGGSGFQRNRPPAAVRVRLYSQGRAQTALDFLKRFTRTPANTPIFRPMAKSSSTPPPTSNKPPIPEPLTPLTPSKTTPAPPGPPEATARPPEVTSAKRGPGGDGGQPPPKRPRGPGQPPRKQPPANKNPPDGGDGGGDGGNGDGGNGDGGNGDGGNGGGGNGGGGNGGSGNGGGDGGGNGGGDGGGDGDPPGPPESKDKHGNTIWDPWYGEYDERLGVTPEFQKVVRECEAYFRKTGGFNGTKAELEMGRRFIQRGLAAVGLADIAHKHFRQVGGDYTAGPWSDPKHWPIYPTFVLADERAGSKEFLHNGWQDVKRLCGGGISPAELVKTTTYKQIPKPPPGMYNHTTGRVKLRGAALTEYLGDSDGDDDVDDSGDDRDNNSPFGSLRGGAGTETRVRELEDASGLRFSKPRREYGVLRAGANMEVSDVPERAEQLLRKSPLFYPAPDMGEELRDQFRKEFLGLLADFRPTYEQAKTKDITELRKQLAATETPIDAAMLQIQAFLNRHVRVNAEGKSRFQFTGKVRGTNLFRHVLRHAFSLRMWRIVRLLITRELFEQVDINVVPLLTEEKHFCQALKSGENLWEEYDYFRRWNWLDDYYDLKAAEDRMKLRRDLQDYWQLRIDAIDNARAELQAKGDDAYDGLGKELLEGNDLGMTLGTKAETKKPQEGAKKADKKGAEAELTKFREMMLEWVSKTRALYADTMAKVQTENERLDDGDPKDRAAIQINNVDIMAKNQMLWALDMESEYLKSKNPLADEQLGQGAGMKWTLPTVRTMYQNTKRIEGRRALPTDATSYYPSQLPGERPRPRLSKIIVGGPKNMGRDLPHPLGSMPFNVFNLVGEPGANPPDLPGPILTGRIPKSSQNTWTMFDLIKQGGEEAWRKTVEPPADGIEYTEKELNEGYLETIRSLHAKTLGGNVKVNVVWTPDNVKGFLENPKESLQNWLNAKFSEGDIIKTFANFLDLGWKQYGFDKGKEIPRVSGWELHHFEKHASNLNNAFPLRTTIENPQGRTEEFTTALVTAQARELRSKGVPFTAQVFEDGLRLMQAREQGQRVSFIEWYIVRWSALILGNIKSIPETLLDPAPSDEASADQGPSSKRFPYQWSMEEWRTITFKDYLATLPSAQQQDVARAQRTFNLLKRSIDEIQKAGGNPALPSSKVWDPLRPGLAPGVTWAPPRDSKLRIQWSFKDLQTQTFDQFFASLPPAQQADRAKAERAYKTIQDSVKQINAAGGNGAVESTDHPDHPSNWTWARWAEHSYDEFFAALTSAERADPPQALENFATWRRAALQTSLEINAAGGNGAVESTDHPSNWTWAQWAEHSYDEFFAALTSAERADPPQALENFATWRRAALQASLDKGHGGKNPTSKKRKSDGVNQGKGSSDTANKRLKIDGKDHDGWPDLQYLIYVFYMTELCSYVLVPDATGVCPPAVDTARCRPHFPVPYTSVEHGDSTLI
ncbi:hypothetical protein Hte_000662 [Hypoxylon texense]